MPVAVALLRGINVGRAQRVPMAELRALGVALGYRDVRTLLNSGNVVFTADAIDAPREAAAIAAALRERCGVVAAVIVKPADTLAAIVAQNPLATPGVDPSRLLVVFAQGAPPAALRRLAASVRAPDRCVVGALAAYLHCPLGVSASPVAARTLGGLGESLTTRNWATVLKLSALVAAGSAPAPPRKARQ